MFGLITVPLFGSEIPALVTLSLLGGGSWGGLMAVDVIGSEIG